MADFTDVSVGFSHADTNSLQSNNLSGKLCNYSEQCTKYKHSYMSMAGSGEVQQPTVGNLGFPQASAHFPHTIILAVDEIFMSIQL